MSVLSNAPLASFDTLTFPYLSRSAKLELRHHVHEYPKMAGGAVEKLGRKLWSFTFECPFHDGHPLYPNLYPDTLDAIVERAAKGDTATLVVPEIGQIRCVITSLDRRRKGAILSGEDVNLTFLEDDLAPLRPRSGLGAKAQLAAMTPAVVEAQAKLLDVDNVIKPQIEGYQQPLGSLLDCLNSLSAIRDQLDLYGQRTQALLGQIKGLSRQLHGILGPASLDPIRQVLRSVWDTATALLGIAQGSGDVLLKPYVVPRTMPVAGIAQAALGSAARGGEILSLNGDIRDPFAVPAGTRLVIPSR